MTFEQQMVILEMRYLSSGLTSDTEFEFVLAKCWTDNCNGYY